MTIISILLLANVVSLSVAFYTLGRLRGTADNIEQLRQLFDERRVPYKVVEDIENIQAVGIRRLQWIRDALEMAIVEHDYETELLSKIRGGNREEGK